MVWVVGSCLQFASTNLYLSFEIHVCYALLLTPWAWRDSANQDLLGTNARGKMNELAVDSGCGWVASSCVADGESYSYPETLGVLESGSRYGILLEEFLPVN